MPRGDPRSTRRYIELSAAWLASLDHATCALCRRPVDLTLPRRHPLGPTVEHTVPVRRILATTSTWAEAVALTCDTSLWAVAHSVCQARQGRAAQAERRRPRRARRPSRAW